METIVVSDTNIFIDLIEVGLLDGFFALPWEVHTTDMIMHELKVAEQHRQVSEYRDCGRLYVKGYDATEMVALARFHSTQRETTKVSIQDCSVWSYALDNGYALLTGDAKLRSAAVKSGVDVHGILYVVDRLVSENLLTAEDAANKLTQLALANPRLPHQEIEKRIRLWSDSPT